MTSASAAMASASASAAMEDIQKSIRTGCVAYPYSLPFPPYTQYGSSYGYVPSLAAGIVFCVLFGLSMIVHTVQFIWKKQWWCAVFSVGCITEILGWAARTWASKCPYNANAYLMQISTLIIAPVFFTAGVYVLLGRFIQILGRDSSCLSPSLYLWIFCTCDVISLIVQAIGGAFASAAVQQTNGDTGPGTNTMIAGIVFQLASITVFVILAADFVRRTLRKNVLQGLKGSVVPLLGAMVFSILCIYVRSIYRTIELAEGWTGYLITTERYFIALDGAMMVCAVVIFNLFHPGWLLPKEKHLSVHREIPSPDGMEMDQHAGHQ